MSEGGLRAEQGLRAKDESEWLKEAIETTEQGVVLTYDRFAPLYDQVATVAWPEIVNDVALKLAGARRFGDIDRVTFARFADKAGLDRNRVLTLVDDTLERLESAWVVARQTGLWKMLPAHTDALHEHWARTPLLADSPLNRR